MFRCIGKGGMAAVFLARDNVLQIERAIKVLKPEYMVRANVRQRFATEAVAMARLSHPNVVQVFDHGQQGMTSFIVMEFVPYGSLQGYLDSIGLLEHNQALTICREVAQAVKLAHDSGIIHRDIKPDNILMHPNGAKLTDFGLARISETSVRQTQTQVVMGTFPYMAPEQRLSAKKTTHQADIYALGATLFAMLSHEDPTELYDQTAHRQLFAKLPDNIALLIATACHTDLQQRYQNADELIAAIDQLLCDTGPSIQLSKKDFSTPVNLEELHRDWQNYTGNGDDDTQPNTQDNPTDTMFFEGLAGAGLAFSDVVDDTRVKGPNFQEELIPKDPLPQRVLTRQSSRNLALIFVTVLLGTIIYLTLAPSGKHETAPLEPETPATILALSTPKSDADQDT